MKFGNWEVCNLLWYMFNEISYMVRVRGDKVGIQPVPCLVYPEWLYLY